MGSCILDNSLQRSTWHCRCAICGWCWTPTAAQDPPPNTITFTDHDVSDVVDYEDAMGTMTIQAFGALETNATKEMQKIMPTAAPVGAKLGSALATQLRAREALDAAMELEETAQKKTDDAMAEMSPASDGVEMVRQEVGPTTGQSHRKTR